MNEKVKEILHNEEVFEVERKEVYGAYTIMWVNYPNCPSPNKILFFGKNAPSDDAKNIMPHFGLEESPVARFVATEDGWEMAVRVAKMMNGEYPVQHELN